MSKTRRYKILLIEPSEIISSGIISIINKSKDYIIEDHISDLTFYNKNKISIYDIIIINPLVLDYSNRFDIKSILSPEIGVVIISLISNVLYDNSLLKQFDNNITLYDTSELIIKKLNTSISSKDDIQSTTKNDLSLREKEILVAVASGKSNKEIAEELNLSVFTVITHRKNISHKLGINSISGLTVYAIMNNLIDMNNF